MKAYGIELRQRVLNDGDGGMTEVTAAEKWKVSVKWIQKIKKQRRETGCIKPKIPKTGPKPKLAPHHELLRKIVAQTPDATLEEIREQLPVNVCVPTVFNELRKLKLVYKKTAPRLRTTSTGHCRKASGMESDATRFGPGQTGVYR